MNVSTSGLGGAIFLLVVLPLLLKDKEKAVVLIPMLLLLKEGVAQGCRRGKRRLGNALLGIRLNKLLPTVTTYCFG